MNIFSYFCNYGKLFSLNLSSHARKALVVKELQITIFRACFLLCCAIRNYFVFKVDVFGSIALCESDSSTPMK